MRRAVRVLAASLASLAVATAAGIAQSPTPGSSALPGSDPTITVVARDQYFVGLPTSLPAGSRLTMTNDGEEVHQMIVARRVDGVTKSWDELLAEPDPVRGGLVQLAGQVFAEPGRSAVGDITLIDTGDYFAVCFVPQGCTVIPDPAATRDPGARNTPNTPVHYQLGMRQEFTVTAPGSTPGPLPTATPAAP